jgi:hypothetical protein
MGTLRSKVIHLAHQKLELRPHLLPLLKEARITEELIRVKYVNLGDFGGTDPVEDSWSLEVVGPTYEHREELRRLGLKWNPGMKSWRLDATLYKYNFRGRNRNYDVIRRQQEEIYDKLQKIVPVWNEAAKAKNDALTPAISTTMPREERIKLHEEHAKLSEKLDKTGLKVGFYQPSRYSSDDGMVYVTGNTYPYAKLMKKHGFRWNPPQNRWQMPTADWHIIKMNWLRDVTHNIPDPPPGVAVFSNIDRREIRNWVEDHWDIEELTEDGEKTIEEGIAGVISMLTHLDPRKQEEMFNRMNSHRN